MKPKKATIFFLAIFSINSFLYFFFFCNQRVTVVADAEVKFMVSEYIFNIWGLDMVCISRFFEHIYKSYVV